MKKTILVAIITLMTPLFIFGFVQAQETQTQFTTNEESSGSGEPKKVLTAQEKVALQERLAKRKASMKLKITAAEKQRIQSRCKNSQGVVSNLQGRIKGVETSRTQVHDNLVARLSSLSQKLAKQNVDTAVLDGQITALQERIVTFKADLTTYKEVVSDLAVLDCSLDPEAFKASLETARTSREKLSLDIKGIRSYVNDTIKPTLKDLRTKVSQDKTEGEGAQ